MRSYLPIQILLLLIAIVPLVTCQIDTGAVLTRPAHCPPIDPCFEPVRNGTCRYGCLPNYKRACDAYTCLPRLKPDCDNICSSVSCLFGWTCEPLISSCSYRCQAPGPTTCQQQCLLQTCPSAKVCSCSTGTPQCVAPDTDGPSITIKPPSCQERCLQITCPTAKVCSCTTGLPTCIAPDTSGPIITQPPPTTCFAKCINFKCPTAKVCTCSSSGNPQCIAPDVSGPITTIDLPIILPRPGPSCGVTSDCTPPFKPISIVSNLRTTATKAGVANEFVISTSNIVKTSSTQAKATIGFKGITANQRKETMEKFVTQLMVENSSVVGTSSVSGSNTVFIIDGSQSVTVTEAMMMTTQTCDDGQDIAIDQVCPTTQDDVIVPATAGSNSSSGSSFPLWIIAVAVGGVVLVVLIAATIVYHRRKVAATVSRMDVANTV